jgi:hypothetical protein
VKTTSFTSPRPSFQGFCATKTVIYDNLVVKTLAASRGCGGPKARGFSVDLRRQRTGSRKPARQRAAFFSEHDERCLALGVRDEATLGKAAHGIPIEGLPCQDDPAVLEGVQVQERQHRLIDVLEAKVAVALQNELGRVPKEEEIEQVTLLARVMYKAVLGLHYKRKEQKKSGQLAIF